MCMINLLCIGIRGARDQFGQTDRVWVETISFGYRVRLKNNGSVQFRLVNTGSCRVGLISGKAKKVHEEIFFFPSR